MQQITTLRAPEMVKTRTAASIREDHATLFGCTFTKPWGSVHQNIPLFHFPTVLHGSENTDPLESRGDPTPRGLTHSH